MARFVIDTIVAPIPAITSEYGRYGKPVEIIEHRGSRETVVEVDDDKIVVDGSNIRDNGFRANLNVLLFIIEKDLIPEKMRTEAIQEVSGGKNWWKVSFGNTEIYLDHKKMHPTLIFTPDEKRFEVGWFYPNAWSSEMYAVRDVWEQNEYARGTHSVRNRLVPIDKLWKRKGNEDLYC